MELKTSINSSYNVGYDDYQRQKSFRSLSEEVGSGVDINVIMAYQSAMSLLQKLEGNYELYLCKELVKGNEDKNKQSFVNVLLNCIGLYNKLQDDEDDIKPSNEASEELFTRYKNILDIIHNRYYVEFKDEVGLVE